MSSATPFLARWRVALGFALGAIAFWLAAPTRATLISGAVLASLGEAFRVWAAGHLQKSRAVTTSGPYKWCAHPLYVGSSVMAAGLAVACASVPVAVLIAVYLGVALPAAARHESTLLRQAFGERYNRYRRGEAARGEDEAGDRSSGKGTLQRFSLARAMANREHRALIGLLFAELLLALKAAANV